MISATPRYDSGASAARDAVRALLALPEGLRPTRHSEDEDKAGRPIGDPEEFLESLADRLSYVLRRGRGFDYDILGGSEPVVVDCYFNRTPSRLVRAFMERMAATGPAFGWACTWEELLHRNQRVAKVGLGTSYGFVGRDHSKFVPGLYWLVLLPQSLAEKHGVPIDQVADAAREHAALGDGQHLFRFYDDPEDWREHADAMDALCARLPGVFDINEVRRIFADGCRDIHELIRMRRPWE